MIDSTKLTQIILTMARHLANGEVELTIRTKTDYAKREGQTVRVEIYIVRVTDTLERADRAVDESAHGLTPEEALKSLLERLMVTLGHRMERLQQAADVLPEELRITAAIARMYCPDCNKALATLKGHSCQVTTQPED
jgi:cystathionine beta-lyase/cystathionine gamma-synthase